MKRLSSLDFMRGIAIFFTLAFHFLFTSWDKFKNPDLANFGIVMQIVAILIFVFIHWRGFFLMISAIVNFYQMERALKKGRRASVIFTKQILAGFVLILTGKLWVTVFPYWGPIETWTRSTTLTFAQAWASQWDLFFMIEAIESIGLMMIITAFLFLLFSNRKLRDKWLVKLIISYSIGIIIIIISPYVQTAINDAIGVQISANGEQFRTFLTDSFWERFWRVPLNWLVGREAPLFPMLGSYFIGAGIGVILTQDKPKKKQLHWLNLVHVILIILGVLDWILIDKMYLDVGFHVHPRWFALLSAGLQPLVIIMFIIGVEFNTKLNKEKWLKWSRYIRRYGIFALTCYFLGIGDALVRFLFQAIFPSQDFISRYSMNDGWTFLVLFTVMGLWSIGLYIWDKIGRGYLSFEFVLSFLRIPKARVKRNWKDPLNLQGILWDVEAISYVEESGKMIENSFWAGYSRFTRADKLEEFSFAKFYYPYVKKWLDKINETATSKALRIVELSGLMILALIVGLPILLIITAVKALYMIVFFIVALIWSVVMLLLSIYLLVVKIINKINPDLSSEGFMNVFRWIKEGSLDAMMISVRLA